MSRLETVAVIKAQDLASKTFAKIADAFQKMTKGGRAAAEIERASKAVASIGKVKVNGLGAVKREVSAINRELKNVAAAPLPLKGFSADLQRQISAMRLSRGELRGLARDYARMQDEQRRALRGLGPSAVRQILEKDGAAIDARLRDRARRLHEIRRLERQIGAGGGGRLGFGAGVAGLGGGYALRRGATAAARIGGEGAREGARDYLAGLTAGDEERLRNNAFTLSRRYPSVTATTLHERLRDTSMSMGSVDRALEVADAIGRASVVLQSLKGKDAAIDEGRQFFAALDNLGKNVDAGQVTRLLHGWTKALGVEGADLRMGDLLQMARISKSGGAALNERFLMTVAPALMQDMGAHRLGTALGSEVSQVIGGRATKESKRFQQQFGLRDRKGRFVNAEMIMRDPFEYTEKVAIPALNKKNIDINDNTAVAAWASKAFSNQTVADLITKLITQREQYLRKQRQYDKAPGLAAADTLPGKDPFVAAAGATAQFVNLVETLATNAMPSATSALNAFALATGRLTEQLQKNPEVAKTAGLGLLAGVPPALWGTGAFLKALAGEGTGVASNALRMAGGGLAAVGRFGTRLLPGAGIVLAGKAVLDEAARRDPDGHAFGRNPTARQMRRLERIRAVSRRALGRADLEAGDSWNRAEEGRIAGVRERLTSIKAVVTQPVSVAVTERGAGIVLAAKAVLDEAARRDPDGRAFGRNPTAREMRRLERIRAVSRRALDRADLEAGDSWNRAEEGRIAGVRERLTSIKAVVTQPVSVAVTGDVKGEMTGKFEVTASSELLRVVDSVKRLSADLRGNLRQFAGNAAGSTGTSSPDAIAPRTLGTGGE